MPPEVRCTNCQENHPTCSRSCDLWKREKEIEVKHKQIVSFLEAKQVLESYMKGPSYVKITTLIASQPDNYRAFIEKLVHLGPNVWPKFQKYLKDIYSKEDGAN